MVVNKKYKTDEKKIQILCSGFGNDAQFFIASVKWKYFGAINRLEYGIFIFRTLLLLKYAPSDPNRLIDIQPVVVVKKKKIKNTNFVRIYAIRISTLRVLKFLQYRKENRIGFVRD